MLKINARKAICIGEIGRKTFWKAGKEVIPLLIRLLARFGRLKECQVSFGQASKTMGCLSEPSPDSELFEIHSSLYRVTSQSELFMRNP